MGHSIRGLIRRNAGGFCRAVGSGAAPAQPDLAKCSLRLASPEGAEMDSVRPWQRVALVAVLLVEVTHVPG
eukprot:3540274-Rhodomonas_salina.3